MNMAPAVFRRELAGWAISGVLCALPSAYWALMVGFKEPAELCAMAAGIALCVVLFAGFSPVMP